MFLVLLDLIFLFGTGSAHKYLHLTSDDEQYQRTIFRRKNVPTKGYLLVVIWDHSNFQNKVEWIFECVWGKETFTQISLRIGRALLYLIWSRDTSTRHRTAPCSVWPSPYQWDLGPTLWWSSRDSGRNNQRCSTARKQKLHGIKTNSLTYGDPTNTSCKTPGLLMPDDHWELEMMDFDLQKLSEQEAYDPSTLAVLSLGRTPSCPNLGPDLDGWGGGYPMDRHTPVKTVPSPSFGCGR